MSVHPVVWGSGDLEEQVEQVLENHAMNRREEKHQQLQAAQSIGRRGES